MKLVEFKDNSDGIALMVEVTSMEGWQRSNTTLALSYAPIAKSEILNNSIITMVL